MKFKSKLESIVQKNDSLVCVGLDPEESKLPTHLKSVDNSIFTFNKAIIDATCDLVCAYKPNIAFYEAIGIEGLQQLKQTLEYIKLKYPDIPVILDAKRGDIGNTARMYAKSAYEYWRADAVTVYPHVGLDSLQPFFEYKDQLTIVLIKTSNPDSGMFQNIATENGSPYYLKLAKTIATWDFDNLGIFVGATYPKEMAELRALFPNHIFLSAGIGAQNATIEEIVKAGIDAQGKGIMFNSSRNILYAATDESFAEKAREATQKLKGEINKYR